MKAAAIVSAFVIALAAVVVAAEEAAKPVELAAPLYRWFEATDLVKAWAKAGGGSIAIRSAPKFVRDASFLEVTYEGKLAEPPQQVAGVSAFYRAGQVFLTWKEIEDVTEGQAQPHWAQLMPKIKGISGEGASFEIAMAELRRAACDPASQDQPVEIDEEQK